MRSRWAAALLMNILVLASLGAAPVAAEDDTDTDTGSGTGLIVTVSPAPVAPTPTPTPTRRGTSSSVGGSGAGPAAGDSVVSDAPPTDLETGSVDGFSLGGVLYVSGLIARYAPALNPLGGTLKTSFTVRNLTDEVVPVRARFWANDPFGGEISRTPAQLITLELGETRTIQTTLPGMGQWTVVSPHFTLTPPENVDGIKLSPLSRDAVVVFAPWFILLCLFLGALAYVVTRWARSNTAPAAVEVPA